MAIQITDHEAAAKARLGTRFESVTEILAILEIACDEVQALETAWWQLYTERTIAAAVGAQLDAIGKVVLQPRAAPTDAVYRLELKARIKILLSSGGPLEILTVFALVHAGTSRLESNFPAGFTLHLEDVESGSNAETLVRFLRDLRAEGVDARLHALTASDAESFALAGVCVHMQAIGGIGDPAISTTPAMAASVPETGSVIIGGGLASEETIAYTARTSGSFTLATPLANAHAISESVVIVSSGKGLGDAADASLGGMLSGTWQA